MINENYYHILGVAFDATESDIKQAYRRCARQCHLDLRRDDHSAEERFKHINAAYTVLSDPAKRAKYNAAFRQHQSSRYERVTATPYQPIARPGYDVTYTIAITPAEALVGTTRLLTFHAPNGQPYQIAISIPAGTITGSRVYVPEAGGPGQKGGQRGDFYAVINVIALQCANALQP